MLFSPFRSNRLRLLFMMALLLSFSGNNLFADDILADDIFADQRRLFDAVERDMKRGSLMSFKRNVSKLIDYPLFPYLEFYELRRRLSSTKAIEIRNFLYKYDRVPVAERLRHEWIRILAKRGDWQSIIEVYQKPVMLEGKDITCYYAGALVHSGRSETARRLLPDLWTVNFSQPKACDFFFNWGFANDLIDDGLIWKRLLLVAYRNPGLARYLGGRLSSDKRVWYQRLIQATRQPETVLTNLREDFFASPFAKDVALAALKTLARKNPETAKRHFEQLRAACRRCEGMPVLQRDLGVFMAKLLKPVIAYEWLAPLSASVHNEQSKYWQIRSALRQENWRFVLRSLASLDDEQKNLPQWRYWYAVAMYETGNATQAIKTWRSLSEQADYYGYLAADKIGAEYRFNTALPMRFSAAELSRFESRAPVARMRELVKLNRLVDARREFLFLTDAITKMEYLKLAVLADQWGWYDGAIRAISASEMQTNAPLRFPLAYRDEVERNARTSKLPEALIYGIMRRESAFMEKVKSPAGALGLMQLMPRTAKMVMSDLRMKEHSEWHILRPDINILLGSNYFAKLYRQYGRQTILSLAAYNAGGTNVRRWLDNAPTDRSDVWVDTITIDETRLYVRAVLFYTIMYAHRLGTRPHRLEEMM